MATTNRTNTHKSSPHPGFGTVTNLRILQDRFQTASKRFGAIESAEERRALLREIRALVRDMNRLLDEALEQRLPL